MKLLVQRVSRAEVKVDAKQVAKIKKGYLVLAGIHKNDDEKKAAEMAEKLINLRVMADESGKMNLSVKEVRGEILVASQFTLYADTKSRRPGFTKAAKGDKAKRLYNYFISKLKDSKLKVESGVFGAYMQVYLQNEGPVTVILEN